MRAGSGGRAFATHVRRRGAAPEGGRIASGMATKHAADTGAAEQVPIMVAAAAAMYILWPAGLIAYILSGLRSMCLHRSEAQAAGASLGGFCG